MLFKVSQLDNKSQRGNENDQKKKDDEDEDESEKNED